MTYDCRSHGRSRAPTAQQSVQVGRREVAPAEARYRPSAGTHLLPGAVRRGRLVLFGKPPSDVEIINDIDQNVVTFFRVVKEKPEELIASFEWELVSRAEFERMAAQNPATLSDVERAHRFYYLIMAGWGGELNYPRFQTSVSDGGHGNRLFGALKTLRERLQPVHDRLRTVIIENLDWQKCMDRYDREGVVMYVDPPYPGNKCNYAHNMRELGRASRSRGTAPTRQVPLDTFVIRHPGNARPVPGAFPHGRAVGLRHEC